MTIAVNETARDRFARQRREDFQAKTEKRAAAVPGFIKSAAALGVLDFTIRVESVAELRAALVTYGGHNGYSPDAAWRALGRFIPEAMHVRVQFDVTGPSIFFGIPFTEQQRIGDGSNSAGAYFIPAEDRRALVEQIIEAGKTLYADELMIRGVDREGWKHYPAMPEKPYEIRLWWD